MMAAYPQIAGATLPADLLLQRLNSPAFRVLFQLMVFAALLESGAGVLHAVNERAAESWRRRFGSPLPLRARLAVSVFLLIGAMEVASRFGLVALIARGYRLIAAALLAVYILPLLTRGIVLLRRGWNGPLSPITLELNQCP
jgi:uncharacterized membrane protein YkvI